MTSQEALAAFERANALLKGHFELASGLHSERYLQCALALQHPPTAEAMCRELARRWQGQPVDVVIGPAVGGVILAYELARALRCRGIFMERKGDRPMELRRGFSLQAGERVIVAEDVMTTGGSVAEIVEEVERRGAKLVGVACLIDRGGAQRFAGMVQSLIRLDIPTYPPADCPLCRDGAPVDKPGSQKLRSGKSAG